MKNNLLINPKCQLGQGIKAFMFTKTFFEQNKSKHENLSLENILAFEVDLPIIWLEQVHGKRVKEVSKYRPNFINSCDGLYTNGQNLYEVIIWKSHLNPAPLFS